MTKTKDSFIEAFPQIFVSSPYLSRAQIVANRAVFNLHVTITWRDTLCVIISFRE
jgi:hypothetical protein